MRIRAGNLLLLLLLAAAGAVPGAVAAEEDGASDGTGGYSASANEVMEYVQETFLRRRSGLYSVSADKREPDFLWGAGVMFSALVGAARHDEKWRPAMRRNFEALDGYWNANAKVPGYEAAHRGSGDRYYDDNAWMVLAFLEAFEVTGDERYRKRARETLEFVMSGWDEQAGGGIWWHEDRKDGTKNTCVNAPAAVGCFRMAKHDPKHAEDWVAKGRKLVDWTTATLRSRNGLFADRIEVESGRVHRGQLSYNAGLMLRAYLGLAAWTGEPQWLDEAKAVATATEALVSSRTGAYRDSIKWSHLMVEADLELFRKSGDEALLARAKADTAHHLREWRNNRPNDLIANASLARQLWLMADHETHIGREFRKNTDPVKP